MRGYMVMRGLSGFLGALLLSGLVVGEGVGALEGKAAVRFLAESQGLSTQPQMSDLPQKWLVAQNAEAEEAQRLFNEGYALFEEGTPESLRAAIEKFEAVIPLLPILEEAVTRYWVGFAYRRLGSNPEALGHYEQAVELLEQYISALEVGQQSGQPFNPDAINERLRTVQIWQGRTLNNIATIYSDSSDLREKSRALEYHNQALPLRRAAGDRGGEANTLYGIGSVYDELGEKSRALEYYNQALPLYREVSDRGGEARTLELIGVIYNDLGEKSRALEFLNQALPLYREVGNLSDAASTLSFIGLIYDKSGEKSRALAYLRQALPLYREISDLKGEAITLTFIGLIHHELGEKSRALEFFNQALPLYREMGDPEGETRILNLIARVQNELRR